MKKTIALDEADKRIEEALQQQPREEPIFLTKDSAVVGLVLKLPEGTKDSDVDGVVWSERPEGRFVVSIEGKYSLPAGPEDRLARPVFGSCQGLLTVVSEDEEHLKDFEEYMS